MKCRLCDNQATVVLEHFYHDCGHCGWIAVCGECAEEECADTRGEYDRPPSRVESDWKVENVDAANKFHAENMWDMDYRDLWDALDKIGRK